MKPARDIAVSFAGMISAGAAADATLVMTATSDPVDALGNATVHIADACDIRHISVGIVPLNSPIGCGTEYAAGSFAQNRAVYADATIAVTLHSSPGASPSASELTKPGIGSFAPGFSGPFEYSLPRSTKLAATLRYRIPATVANGLQAGTPLLGVHATVVLRLRYE